MFSPSSYLRSLVHSECFWAWQLGCDCPACLAAAKTLHFHTPLRDLATMTVPLKSRDRSHDLLSR